MGADFQMNLELLQNAFRSGYYQTSEKFQGLAQYPYREDGKVKSVKSLTFQKDYSGNEADIRFNIQEVSFSSRINSQLKRIIEDGNT